MRKILLRLSDQEHGRLLYLADRLGISVSETLRISIPSIEVSEPKKVKQLVDIRNAKPSDLVPCSASVNRKKLSRLLKAVKEERAALTLAKEIRCHILARDSNHLTVSTYKRLGRWCHPRRWTGREKRIKPLARQISEVLFGRVIDRVD